MKFRFAIALITIVALLFSACAPAVVDPTADSSTAPTAQDIFRETTAPTADSAPPEDSAEPSFQEIHLGNLTIGPHQWLSDSFGPYVVYEGGEMELSFTVDATGSIAAKGVGVLLFVDGLPQPYKTEKEPEYAYLHTFYPGVTDESVVNFYFTPVTGKQGDDLEIYAASILHPTYSRSEGDAGMVYTGGSIASGFRLKYEQTPPEEVYPEKLPWLSETAVSFRDTTVTDIAGWRSSDLQERVGYRLRVNDTAEADSKKNIVYGVSDREPFSVRYEIWGSPYVNFGLVLFVDNIPVADTAADPLMINIQNGQKTVVETQLQLEQFDGESVIYAVLVPRNWRTSEVRTGAFLESTGEIYLVEEGS